MSDTRAPKRQKIANPLRNPKYSDFRIKCGDREWAVHRNVVCSQSDFFARASDGGFKEATEGCVTLKDDKPNVVHAALEFLYEKDYDDEAFSDDQDYYPLLTNIYLVEFASKYNIPGLKTLAETKFKSRSDEVWADSPAAFARAVREVFGKKPIPEALKDVRSEIVCTCVLQVEDWFSNAESFAKYWQLHRHLKKFGAFASDVAALASKDLADTKSKRVPRSRQLRAGEQRVLCRCGRMFVLPEDLRTAYCPGCGKLCNDYEPFPDEDSEDEDSEDENSEDEE